MQSWQTIIVFSFGIIGLSSFLKGFYECRYKKNAFGLTPAFNIIGAFVWGDAVVFGIFWVSATAVSLILRDWTLFLLITSVFWLVRSVGETIYWLNQQFSTINRNEPHKQPFHNIFHNDSIWYVLQIFWQCVSVVTIITTLYLAKEWLQ